MNEHSQRVNWSKKKIMTNYSSVIPGRNSMNHVRERVNRQRPKKRKEEKVSRRLGVVESYTSNHEQSKLGISLCQIQLDRLADVNERRGEPTPGHF